MGAADLSGLNAGYVAQLLEDYLEAPGSVPPEWQHVFESDGEAVVAALPGLQRLLERREAPAEPAPVASPAPAAPSAPRPLRLRLPPPVARAGRRCYDTPRRRRSAGRDVARSDRGGDGAREGIPHARSPRGPPRPARLGADG